MKPTRSATRSARLTLVLLWGLLALVGVVARGRAAEAGKPKGVKTGEVVRVFLQQSQYIEPPWPVVRVSVTDTEVADVQVITPRHVLVLGKAVGTTDLLLWNEKDESVRIQIEVAIDLRSLRADLETLFPHAKLRITEAKRFIVLDGEVDRAETLATLRRYLELRGLQYVDKMRLAGVQQVLVKVRVAEVSRTALRELGVNGFYAHRPGYYAGSNVGNLNPANVGVPSGTVPGPFQTRYEFLDDLGVNAGVTVFGAFPSNDLELFVRALAENQYLRLLAEPTLVALSGEEASFLAGGEYPIPVVQGGGGGGGTSISVEYHEYGVRLKFRPTVLGDGLIRLQVAPEVSELSESGAVEIQGFAIPAKIVRKAETTLELNSGQTFAMAGLLNRSTNAANTRVPLVGDLPILGALFRSIRYRRNETELVVLVTVSLAEPLSQAKAPPLPGVLHTRPSDWAFYLLGCLEGTAPAKLSPTDAAALKSLGFDRLVGPGAWESYGQGVAPSLAASTPKAAATRSDRGGEASAGAAPPQPAAPTPGQW